MVAGALDQGLGLGRVIAHVLLGHLRGLLRVLLGSLADLGRLGIHQVARVLELRVDELLVGGVDERREEDDGRGDDGQRPVGYDLDEVVREEGGDGGLGRGVLASGSSNAACMAAGAVSSRAEPRVETTYSSRRIDILDKQDALGLDDKEVEELVDVANQGVERLAMDGVVLAGPELGCEAVVKDELPSDLGGDGDAKDHPGELERPAQHIEVPNREDERDDRAIGDGRGACTTEYSYQQLVPGF